MSSVEPTPPHDNSTIDQSAESHRLRLIEVELVGGARRVPFLPGLNLIVGDITTGKTTFVRLIRALLGTMPRDLAPEVDYLSAIRGNVMLGDQVWHIYRPRTTTRDALVEVSEDSPEPGREPTSLRVPVAAPSRSYSEFLLESLTIPAVSVPQARNQPTGNLTPVTMTDWLGYCIITGDELDTEVFGHRRDWRNLKRRWIFELAYGYYDPDLALLNAKLRSIELQLNSLEQSAAIREKFLADTPFSDLDALRSQLTAREEALQQVVSQRHALSVESNEIPGVQELRQTLLASRSRRADLASRAMRLEGQIADLSDLYKQLKAQSARLTRAIVADEWLVDFDFIVCPRCGNDIDAGRTDPHLCYLCMQPPRPSSSREHLLVEQERIASQLSETTDVIESRRTAHEKLLAEIFRLDELIAELSTDLDRRMQAFVSDQANRIEHFAAEQARIEAEKVRLQDYIQLLMRHEAHVQDRDELERQRDELISEISGRELSQSDAEDNVNALEERMTRYLRELHIPDLGQELSVTINRKTYLPEVSGRTFEELSSQGLKTLVNIAHALAHHTVCIDRRLPMPGLLILDGISANAGHEGFDRDRVRDVYRLLDRVAREYEDTLQVVAVDNEISRSILVTYSERIILTLNQNDRLIRNPSVTT